jgi:transposase
MRVTQHMLDDRLKEYDGLVDIYKKAFAVKNEKRDWRTYEQRLALRIRTASTEIEPVIKEAYEAIELPKSMRGKPSSLPVTKKVLILMLKDIFRLSNRKMTNMLAMFSALTGIDISYKTVERAYSDPVARMVIHNAFVILTERKGIKSSDTSGDGTGYGLTVTRHYRNEREKELKSRKGKRKGKKNELLRKRRPFVYAFALMDLDTRMYIGYGTSIKSEKEAFDKAVAMAKSMGIAINSVRLDKYYSFKSIVKSFSRETKIYVIPKKNATIKGGAAWRRIICSFVFGPFGHLGQYFLRNNSESGFSADKKTSGWQVFQVREERIDTAIMCKGL